MLHLQISTGFTLRHYICQQLLRGKAASWLAAQPTGVSAVRSSAPRAAPQDRLPRGGSRCRAEQLAPLSNALPLLLLVHQELYEQTGTWI